MGDDSPHSPKVYQEPSPLGLMVSGLLVSLIAGGALVRLRFGGLDDSLSFVAGVAAGVIVVPVALAQLAARKLLGRPRRFSPLVLHAVVVPWLTALAAAAAIDVGTSLALAEVRAAEGPTVGCAAFGELASARWSLAPAGGPAFVARLPDGSGVEFDLTPAGPKCRRVSARSGR